MSGLVGFYVAAAVVWMVWLYRFIDSAVWVAPRWVVWAIALLAGTLWPLTAVALLVTSWQERRRV